MSMVNSSFNQNNQNGYLFEKMLVLAFALHVAVIIGIGARSFEKPKTTSQILDIRLMKSATDAEPNQAEFIAENNRLGHGEHEESQAIDKPLESKPTQQKLNTPKARRKPSDQKKQARVITASTSIKNISTKPNTQISPDLLSQSLKQVALQSRSDYLEETFKKHDRVKRVTLNSTAAKQASYAYYLKLWQQAIERYGTRRYPQEAKGCTKDICNLILLVAINNDGTLKKLNVLKSSGRPSLDDFAISTIERTMPFSPFSNNMKEEMDVLEIVRKFEFIDKKGIKIKAR